MSCHSRVSMAAWQCWQLANGAAGACCGREAAPLQDWTPHGLCLRGAWPPSLREKRHTFAKSPPPWQCEPQVLQAKQKAFTKGRVCVCVSVWSVCVGYLLEATWSNQPHNRRGIFVGYVLPFLKAGKHLQGLRMGSPIVQLLKRLCSLCWIWKEMALAEKLESYKRGRDSRLKC